MERAGKEIKEAMIKDGVTKSAGLVLMAETTRDLMKGSHLTIDEAREAAQGECDAEGIDPTWNNAERCTRLIDIQQGSPLMHEERERKAAYTGNKFKDHVNNVVKDLPPSVTELQRTKHGY